MSTDAFAQHRERFGHKRLIPSVSSTTDEQPPSGYYVPFGLRQFATLKKKQEAAANPHCDLCNDPEFPMHRSPRNPISYRRFTDKIENVTEKQSEFLREFAKKPYGSLTVCNKHMKNRKITIPIPDVVHPPANEVEHSYAAAPKKGDRYYAEEYESSIKLPKIDESAEKRCDVCHKPTEEYFVSPPAPLAEQFFAQLLATKEERRMMKWFLNSNEQAYICMRHVPDNVAPYDYDPTATGRRKKKGRRGAKGRRPTATALAMTGKPIKLEKTIKREPTGRPRGRPRKTEPTETLKTLLNDPRLINL